VVLFVNGLPLVVIELKNPADENATIWSAFQQLQTYQAQIPALFAYNVAPGRLRRSAGARRDAGRRSGVVQALAHDRRRDTAAPFHMPELQVLLEGVFDRGASSTCIAYFIVFEDTGDSHVVKKMAGYHQFHAVNVAVEGDYCARPVLMDGHADQGPLRRPRKPGGEPGDRASASSGTPRARARA
jgi:type I restriction enzyme R subunit